MIEDVMAATTNNGIEKFLNSAIPLVLLVIFVAFIGYKFKEPLTNLYEWLKGLFSSNKDRFKPRTDYIKEIVYE